MGWCGWRSHERRTMVMLEGDEDGEGELYGFSMKIMGESILVIMYINFLLIFLALTKEVVGQNSLSNEREIQVNELLKNLNKPAIKTIKSEDGDTVDCVDIHNQPALDHPLLKNHTIQMAPSFATKWEDTLKPTFEWTWQKSGSCPEGTVPIRRISRDDILRANSIESFGKKDVLGANGSVETAGIKPPSNPPSYGTKGYINVWSVHVEPDEWSQSALIVGNTNGEAHSFIEAGWGV
ncbi:hypothetical protein QJS10_CPB18g00857 [Acorus calamus]|uniref:Neprosin activation peptide domain-containing protein n=1 Tax=Acorus calamus TaxID=4465 RepID=A0AAV9CQ75_ACOCL|nr:hypothetical protein QJS10_CPB18g00857 [Acorus calamus]